MVKNRFFFLFFEFIPVNSGCSVQRKKKKKVKSGRIDRSNGAGKLEEGNVQVRNDFFFQEKETGKPPFRRYIVSEKNI